MGLFGSKPATGVGDDGLGGPPAAAPGFFSGSTAKYIIAVLGSALLLYLMFVAYNWARRRQGLQPIELLGEGGSGDKTPSPVDGKTKTIIPAGELPVSGSGDHGLQFWMFIKDWDYRFGQAKDVLARVSSSNASHMVPRITLSPSDNTLDIALSIFPTGTATTGVSPTGDTQVCSVENVPLQSWFSVSMTVFQRNLDIYINGRLVKSCVLQGVPRIAMGDIVLADKGGFSGSICNVNVYNKMLNPQDALAFYTAGTNCKAPTGTANVDPNSLFVTLFGRTFRFSSFNKKGEELSSYTL